jgi:cobalt/nickel transport system permease protein
MSKISNAINEIHEADELADRKSAINGIHPLAKLVVTLIYITAVVSFHKYELAGLLPMAVCPFLLLKLADIPVTCCFRKLRVMLPVVCFLGVFNPVFDRILLFELFGIPVTGGMVSMLTLILKGTFALMASFLLIATTGMDRICYGLKLLHVPGFLVTQILLIYRYITVLLSEANTVAEAYSLRAPKQKGVRYRIWGPLLGQLLLRSMDRAAWLYDSMLLRGFTEEFHQLKKQKFAKPDYLFLLLWLFIIAALRLLATGFLPVFFIG